MEKPFTIFGRKVSLKMFNSEPKTNTNSEMKKFERISAILGREVTAETVLTGAELEMIENHSETPNTEASTQPAPTAEEIAASMTGSITEAVATAIAPFQQSLTALETRIAQMEEGAGAEATVTKPTNGAAASDFSATPWLDPNNKLNKAAESALKS